MPNSAPITKQFLKDELFKQSTLFAKAFNQLIERMDSRFEKIDQRFDKLDKKFVTKKEWSGDISQIMGELKAIREEQQTNYNIDVRQNKRLDAIETHLNLAVA